VELSKVVVACGWLYVSYLPHLDTLVQVLSANVVARYYRSKCEDVLMVTARWNEALKPLPAGHKIGEAKPLFRKIEASSGKLAEMLEKVREKLSKVD